MTQLTIIYKRLIEHILDDAVDNEDITGAEFEDLVEHLKHMLEYDYTNE